MEFVRFEFPALFWLVDVLETDEAEGEVVEAVGKVTVAVEGPLDEGSEPLGAEVWELEVVVPTGCCCWSGGILENKTKQFDFISTMWTQQKYKV